MTFRLKKGESLCGKKGQSSFELFLTYSWFIFVIFGVIGILFFSGFFDGWVLFPERCDFFFLDCSDFSVSGNGLKIALKNTQEEPIIIREVVATSDALTGYCRSSSNYTEIGVGEVGVVNLYSGNCSAVDTGQSKNYYDLSFSYSWSSALTATDTFSGVLLANSPCSHGTCGITNNQPPPVTNNTPPLPPSVIDLDGITLIPGLLNPLDKAKDDLPIILKQSKGFFADFEKKLVYVTSKERNSVQILDVSDPNNIEFLDNIIDNESLVLRGARGIFVDDGLAYVVSGKRNILENGTWVTENGVQILDVSDPNNISALGSIKDSSSLTLKSPIDVFVDNGLAYVTSSGDKGVQILDVSDPNNITPLDKIDDKDSYNDLALDGPNKIFVDGGLAYVTSRTFSSQGVQILDVSDPNNINALGSIFESDSLLLSSPSGIFVANDAAYVTSESGDNGVQILDVSDPNNITALGSIKDNENLLLSGAVDIFVDSNGLAHVVSHRDDGVQILDVSDPTNIISVTNIKTPRNQVATQYSQGCKANKIFINASLGLAYLGGGPVGCIQILDLSNYQILGHESADSFFAFDYAGSLSVEGGLAYVAGNFEGVQVLNVTNPVDITFLGNIRGNLEEVRKVFALNGLVYVAGVNSGEYRQAKFQILDARDPNNVTMLNEATLFSRLSLDPSDSGNGYFSGGFLDLFVQNERAYVAVSDQLYVLDVSDSGDIVLLGTTEIGQGVVIWSLFVDNGRAYLAAENGLHVLDVRDPAGISVLGSITHGNNAELALGKWSHLVVDGGSAYVTSSEGVQILDVRDPAGISVLGGITDDSTLILNGHLRSRISVDGNLAYVSSYENTGIQVLNVGDPSNIVPVTSLTEGTEEPSKKYRPFDDEGYFSLADADNASIALRGPFDIFVDDGVVYVTSWFDNGLQTFKFIPLEE